MPTPAMPVKLLVVIALLGLSLLLDLYSVTGMDGGAVGFIRIGLNIALLGGLLSGKEWARSLAKVTAILCLIGGGILLIQLLQLGALAFMLPSLGYFAYSIVALSLVYGVFMLWTMSQDDVQAWLAARVLRD